MNETTGKVVTSEGLTGIYLSPLIHFHRVTDIGIKWKYYTPLVNLGDDHQGFYFGLRSSRIDSTDLQLSRLDPSSMVMRITVP
ncbi:hypothetical protein EAF00_002033 [Botryotinia globosa]|nr:hypothetical protein EAF00_002033 [Botryotinia globosa]